MQTEQELVVRMRSSGAGSRFGRSIMAALVAVLGAAAASSRPVAAQAPAATDAPGQTAPVAPTPVVPAPSTTSPASPAQPSPATGNTTVVPRTPGDAATASPQVAQVKLVALLTSDGQKIDKGIVWRVFEEKASRDGKPKVLSTLRDPTPVLKLPPGDYVVNASYGRAHLTRKISAKAGGQSTEQFVLNAGGLRVTALLGTQPAPANAVTYSIFSDERDQLSTRSAVMTGAKPGLIIRLNAGLYQIVSTYGDANAVIRADVNVEAGKLTEATLAHSAGKVTFKLVDRAGGEALADTKWTIQTLQGELVKESVGALPIHHLAPGNYAAIAQSGGRRYRRDFSLQNGDNVVVEIVQK